MDILHSILFTAHMLGLAAVIGTFFVQMRKDDGFAVGVILAGAITQVVSGVGLVGVAQAGDHDLNMIKITVKLVIALVVLVAAILAFVAQRRGGRVKPWFHTAGGLAIVNVVVAVFWH
ncbi:hypothetical protein [Protaetiibacter mangrovi]|uniref:Integral membrane protein n=1 Tax=Protaetiibacter mangrovi TaxID=2970926 RepID=A0ABT1ZGD0_9MICO|nr:hypothetical protein [Protaetiibacter mangrovi]MCS0499756.1 hypothetical protein [Protaetiibacter mangrovi]TPW91116.1 hypothetical protein FJ656_36160 [Schumannella luteola]